jgi:hypothetical protein
MTDAIQLDPPNHAALRRTWAWFALGAALLIWAHGCHGPDEDHELFARLRGAVAECTPLAPREAAQTVRLSH